ncbi:hypothetical protein LshimejAT787_0505250 [Lyophyllum shimeji]|uniref:Uncharacterized protein n=1 Tax=Lyophyllum shimeji TaxID=47721 RepID=A0A9P3PMK3_LYOSH|nr:hypothetical protein LshimejAT787_0505250 [Lyophyllum shimeji]
MGAESLASVHGILHHCTQLQELSISNQVDYVADPEVRSELITLERLHYLKVEISDLWGTAMLDTFVLPALRTLSITGGRRLPSSTILTLLHRSGCMLTRFVYDGDHLLDDYVTRQLIAHMPSLTSFHAPRLGPDDERKLIFEDVRCDRWWEGTGGQSARRGDWSEGDEQEVDEDEDETDEEDEERRGE